MASKLSRFRRAAWRRTLTCTLLVGTAVTLAAAAPADAGDPAGAPPVVPGSRYLALGDSVTFGYREATNTPPPNYSDAAGFVGYPEDVAAELSVRATNAACPGETSASLVDASAPSNGCESAAGSSAPGYRTLYPLHVAYPHSQLSFGLSFLRRHPDTRLVSLMIGANDGFLCQSTTADHCASELPGVLARVGRNVSKILRQIRTSAHYGGQIVIVDYYSLNYSDAADDASSQALNTVMNTAAAPYDVTVADGYGAFQNAAAQYGGDSCAAGLLTRLTSGGCGVHPSVAGQELLAGAVERVITKG